MDILFIVPQEKPGLKYEINGTMLLATKLLQNDISADVLRFCQFESFGKDYSAFIEAISAAAIARKPRCVSFYTMWPTFHIIQRIARRIKELAPEIPVVMGGPLTTLYPETILENMPWVDYVCTGEGEYTIVPFAQALLSGGSLEQIPGLYYRRYGTAVSTGVQVPLCDLEELPQWDDRLVLRDPEDDAKHTSPTYYMQLDAGRGCPFSCTFCSTSRVWKRKYRLKSPERIMKDMEYLHEKYGVRSFMFSHDAFTVNSRLIMELCDRIAASETDFRWDCATRVNCVNEELLLKMKESGMQRIQMGVESGSERIQKLINKNVNLEDLKRITAFLLKNKVAVELFFMYGFPEETEEDLEKTVRLFLELLQMGVRHMSMALCTFGPGTQMTDECYDRLFYPEEKRLSSRNVFGYQEEEEEIKTHKAVYPFFYHLSTPLRDEYRFLNRWAEICQMTRKALPFIRQLYRDDVLRFCRDFIRKNPQDTYGKDREKPYQMLLRAVEDFDHPQLNALIAFLEDNGSVSAAKEDASIEKTYDFCYLDYMRKLPLDAWNKGKTTIRLSKINGKTEMKILDMQ